MSELDTVLAEGHESRLQRLESESQDLRSGVTEIAVTVKHLDASLNSKLDSLLDAMKESGAAAAKFQDNTTKRLKPLEEAEKARKARWNITKKALVPILLGAAGVVGSRFGAEFWEWLTK